jgi:hypothetical protein
MKRNKYLIITDHAKKRMKERNISVQDIYKKNGKTPTVIKDANVVITTFVDDESRKKSTKKLSLKGLGVFSKMFTAQIPFPRQLCIAFMANNGKTIDDFRTTYKCFCSINKFTELASISAYTSSNLQSAKFAIERYKRSKDILSLELLSSSSSSSTSTEDFKHDMPNCVEEKKQKHSINESEHKVESDWDKYWEQFL